MNKPKMRKPKVTYDDKHASMISGSMMYYYGEKFRDGNNFWQFCVWSDEIRIMRKTPKLPEHLDGENPERVLLYLIASYQYLMELKDHET